ncbi:MAG: extracellular solute-binding protein [Candidatus Methylomirabilales bacterium]
MRIRSLTRIAIGAVIALMVGAASARAAELRLLTWKGYAPNEVVEQFEKETGIKVNITYSNNEEMISKLRATGGAGFDLAQPSQDRITGIQQDYKIYGPFDLSKVNTNQFISSMLEATKKNTTLDGQVYGLPHIWGTDGLLVNKKAAAGASDYLDLCDSKYTGRVSYRAKRPVLIAFAFATGKDPFALYADKAAYKTLMEQIGEKLIACKKHVKDYWTNGDALLAFMRTGEVTLAMGWDSGGWKLTQENPDLVFVAPKSGALGWIDTFSLPAKARELDAAYKWINFVMRPEIAGKVAASAGNFTASKGSDKYVDPVLSKLYQASFPPKDVDNIKWYPAVPAGLEEIEGNILEKVRAAASR